MGQRRDMVLRMLILLVLAIAIGVALSASRRSPPDEHLPSLLADDRSPSELAAEDPVAALLRYGTPDDAARLKEQGVDLGGLGYRAPRDE